MANETPYFCCGNLPSEGHRATCRSEDSDDPRAERPACDCKREMWQIHTAECAIVKAHQRYWRRPERVHSVGCVCESCSAAYERDAWDPRMGEK